MEEEATNQRIIELTPKTAEIAFENTTKTTQDDITQVKVSSRIWKLLIAEGQPHVYVQSLPEIKVFAGQPIYVTKVGDALDANPLIPEKMRIEARGRTYDHYDLDLDKHKEPIYETLIKYATHGWDLDEKLTLPFFASGLIKLPLDSPSDLQRYAPHMIIFTNPSTGKSSIANRLGHRIEHASLTGLIGSADLRNVAEGILHNNCESIFLDEILETRDQETYALLSSIMENGKAYIARGKGKTINTRSAMVFMGNPRRTEQAGEDNSLAMKFTEMIYRITLNTQAFSRRIGYTLFSNSIQTAKAPETPLTTQELKKAEIIYRAVQTRVQSLFLETLQNQYVNTWLEQKDKTNEKTVERIKRKTEVDLIKDYMTWSCENHRHAKGLALRIAIAQNIEEYLKGEITDKELITEAKQAYKMVTKWTNDSLLSIANAVKSDLFETVSEEENKDVLENSPEYIKLLMNAVQLTQTRDNMNEFTLEDIKPHLKIAVEGTSYEREPGKVIRRFKQNAIMARENYLHLIGFTYIPQQERFKYIR